jgi:hypothetical protein
MPLPYKTEVRLLLLIYGLPHPSPRNPMWFPRVHPANHHNQLSDHIDAFRIHLGLNNGNSKRRNSFLINLQPRRLNDEMKYQREWMMLKEKGSGKLKCQMLYMIGENVGIFFKKIL